YGFIDKTEREVNPFRYDEVTDFIEGLAKVKLDDKEGVIDRFGNELWKE
ncbi:MAG: WG repeat-containing protein, partial [Rikenellaceae bacterium]|nr:WG repeat-containing protein [Rikenellaceae bacterium]